MPLYSIAPCGIVAGAIILGIIMPVAFVLAFGIMVACVVLTRRAVAQFGSAPALGAGCRRFKSCQPDPESRGITTIPRLLRSHGNRVCDERVQLCTTADTSAGMKRPLSPPTVYADSAPSVTGLEGTKTSDAKQPPNVTVWKAPMIVYARAPLSLAIQWLKTQRGERRGAQSAG